MNKDLIALLETNKKNKYVFEDIDKSDLVNQLLDNIGHPDSHIRDDLVYPNLAHLLHDKHFAEEELSMYLKRLIGDEFLMYDIENKLPNSVLVRSFSLLQIAIMIFVHRRDSLIDKELIDEAYKRFIKYYELETIYEGYNETVGWLHSVAHSADVMDQFMQVDHFGVDKIEEMFNCILHRFKNPNELYSHDEDERTVVALINGLKRQHLSKEIILKWVDKIATYEKTGQYPEIMYLTNNIKHLLRSLYFGLIEFEEYAYLTSKIQEVLKEKVTQR